MQRSITGSVVTVLIMVLVLLVGCATNPVTGARELSFVSESKEIDIGTKQFLPTQQMQGGQYQLDPELSRYIDQVGQRLAAVSDRQLPYEFVVLNNSTPNAWTLPGGKIAVNRGLLLELDSEAELAAVLSHEIVHAAARHGAKSMQRGMLLQGAIMATAIATSQQKYNNYIVQGAALGAQFVNQTYGRSAERESDYYGMHYMARAGYNPAAAINLQETFVRLSKDRQSSWLDGLFASHPPSMERVENNRKTVAELGNEGELGRERYQQKIAHLHASKPAYDAYDEAQKKLADDDLEMAMTSLDTAISLEPREGQFYGLQGDILLQQKRYRAAITSFNDALFRDDGYFKYYLGRGIAHARLGDGNKAKLDLDRSNQLLPTAITMNELGKIALKEGDHAAAKSHFRSAASAGGELGREASVSFIKLDLPDSPDKYIKSTTALNEEGLLVINLVNESGLDIGRVVLELKVSAGSRSGSRRYTVSRLLASERIQLSSGLTFSEENPPQSARVSIVDISLL